MASMQQEHGGQAEGWFRIMETASEYRKYAEECRALAKNAKTAQQREILLEMAQAWLQLAEDADGKVRDKRNNRTPQSLT
jgi:hypothetical protein